MDFQYERPKVLSSIKQVTLPTLVLPISHRAAEDEMGGDSIYDSVHIGVLTLSGYNLCGSPRAVLGTHPGSAGQDLPVGENPAMAQTFLNQFIKVQSN